MATAKKPAAPKPAAGKAAGKSLVIGKGNTLPVDAKAVAEMLAKKKNAVLDKLSKPSTPGISLKGKTFELPGGVITDGPIVAVIVDFGNVNALYDGMYDPKNPEPPICFAAGTGSPDDLIATDASPEKQFDNCKECPLNQWGSGSGDGKACKNTRRLAVALLSDIQDEDREGEIPIYSLNVSPTAIKFWDGYVRRLAQDHDLMPVQVLTKIGFDANLQYASLRFAADGYTDTEVIGQLLGLENAVQDILTQEPDWAGFEAQRAEKGRKPSGSKAKPAARRR